MVDTRDSKSLDRKGHVGSSPTSGTRNYIFDNDATMSSITDYIHKYAIEQIVPLSDSGVQVSVVIPVLNEEALIERTLQALNEQTRHDFEVIVVDNGSTDSTKEKVTALSGSGQLKYNLYLMPESKKGIGYARKRGMDQCVARGVNYIAGTDADTIVPSDWVESIYRGFKVPDADLLCGESNPFAESGSFKQIHNAQLDLLSAARRVFFNFVKPSVRGHNFAIKAASYCMVDGVHQPIDEHGVLQPGEDDRLGNDILSADGKICPALSTVIINPRRYLTNIIEAATIATWNGEVYHAASGVTDIRDDVDLVERINSLPEEAFKIYSDKTLERFFRFYALLMFTDDLYRKHYWEGALTLFAPQSKEMVEADIRAHADDSHWLWLKYKDLWVSNIKELAKRLK